MANPSRQNPNLPYTGWALGVDWDSSANSHLVDALAQRRDSDGPWLNDGQWHFLCGVFESSTKMIASKIYVDGELGSMIRHWGPHPDTLNDLPLWIGNRAMAATDGFKGWIDEVRIYNHELTKNEIRFLHDGSTAEDTRMITSIGFSTDPLGDQDVTEFLRDETIYVRVRDVDAEGGGSVHAYFKQLHSALVSVKLTEGPDGAFRGLIPASRFRVGPVDMSIVSFACRRGCLWKTTRITILRGNGS